MKYLLFFYGPNGDAAKRFAEPVRHRRHHAFLRDIEAWRSSGRDVEPCDGLILMLGGEEPKPSDLLKAYKHVEDVRHVRPGDPIWDPSEDDLERMNPLNRLRHDAALLGIEVDPAYDEDRLAGLIKVAKGEAAEHEAAEEAEATRIAAEAEAAAKAREGAGNGAGEPPSPVESSPAAAPAPAAGEAGEDPASAGDAQAATEPAAPPEDENAVKLAELANIPQDDAAALRAFANANNIPVNPNPRTSAVKVLAAIKIALGG